MKVQFAAVNVSELEEMNARLRRASWSAVLCRTLRRRNSRLCFRLFAQRPPYVSSRNEERTSCVPSPQRELPSSNWRSCKIPRQDCSVRPAPGYVRSARWRCSDRSPKAAPETSFKETASQSGKERPQTLRHVGLSAAARERRALAGRPWANAGEPPSRRDVQAWLTTRATVLGSQADTSA